MKIASSDIQFAAQHAEVQRHVRKESLVAGVSSRPDAWEPSLLEGGTEVVREEEQAGAFAEGSRLIDLYRAGEDLREVGDAVSDPRNDPAARPRVRPDAPVLKRERNMVQLPVPVEGTALDEYEASAEDKAKIRLIVSTIESLTGKKIKLMEPAELMERQSETLDPADLQAPRGAEEGVAPQAGAQGMRYLYHETTYEGETTTFEAEGVVKTEDGEEIGIDVALTMSREFTSEKSISIFEGAAVKDPLVINFGGTAAELTQTRYAFDIDNDGTDDQIHFVMPNSGFLALDKNGDGTVNNGDELFGPTSGDGFEELAAYDTDQNGWIDENDPVYSGLRIWSKDAQGNDQLLALGQRGVGAVYLGHATTPFQVKDRENELQGVVRSSGVYLNEGGGAGTVQQVDLVV